MEGSEVESERRRNHTLLTVSSFWQNTIERSQMKRQGQNTSLRVTASVVLSTFRNFSIMKEENQENDTGRKSDLNKNDSKGLKSSNDFEF